MKIMAVGDIHGDWGSINNLINHKHPDIILQCGDFGWWPKMEVTKPVLYGNQKEWVLKGIKPFGTRIYFCDGNHEEHTSLSQDGFIHEMYAGVFHASRGSVLTLEDGRNVLFIGGADSIDKGSRIVGHDWYSEENISYTQFDLCMSIEDKIDIVISHTCPGVFEVCGSEGKLHDPNRIALDAILNRYKPDLWVFGHWHKYQTGFVDGTRWIGLDYPKHGEKWWEWIK